MSDNNRNLRVRIDDGMNDKFLSVKLDQDIENIELMSLKISTENAYKRHNSDYGCVVGRVLANGGVGVPNVKISMFVRAEPDWLDEETLSQLYPYTSVVTKNDEGIRYNLLPEEMVKQCHTPVGTMPSKRLLLDDNTFVEIYEKFYKFTTVTNHAGDYMLFGIPTGTQIIHSDLDLSDCGFLSQKPRDMMYNGYDANMFENPNKFKSSKNLDNLAQIIGQNDSVYVYPFWGNENDGDEVNITRNDININYEFKTTCIFIGSLVTDEAKESIDKSCIPNEGMGRMSKLMTGNGRIEMIRKNANGGVEEFQIDGNELIDGNGTWCYQIPMNLDYVKTDEYGNLVPSEDPTIGIATRARVRFRISLNDYESDFGENHLAKVLVPNNPETFEDLDYHFGSVTKDDDEGTKSFRDLFWNNVYTVKSYIPRLQHKRIIEDRNRRFTGFKEVNLNDGKNPIPYNNMRIRLTFMFILQCAILKMMLWFMKVINRRIFPFIYRALNVADKVTNSTLGRILGAIFSGGASEIGRLVFDTPALEEKKKDIKCLTVGDGLCPDLDGWYFAPSCEHEDLFKMTFNTLKDNDRNSDVQSIDYKNRDDEGAICLTNKVDYLMQCVEINLAQEYEIIKFDFYNDWINGLVYLPHWYARHRKKRTLLFGWIKRPSRIDACFDEATYSQFGNSSFKKKRRISQHCSLSYKVTDDGYFTDVTTPVGCTNRKWGLKRLNCHGSGGRKYRYVFNASTSEGRNAIAGGGGVCHAEETLKGEKVYYFKPCEFHRGHNTSKHERRINMFATDLVLLGSLNDCDENGIPQAFRELPSSSYVMPSNLASTNMGTEGYMYAYGKSKTTICNNKRIEEPIVALSGTSQTIGTFIQWTKKTDEYEAEPVDVTEYAVTESAGIDWGYTGPNQGEPNSAMTYNPGGHFLGISCFNSEASIKSCVNLSRICEVGANPSTRDYVVMRKDDKGGVEFAYTQPTGLVSKDELSDGTFRAMFATMNLNGLKTVTDEKTNYRRYEFISNNPTNFGGELKQWTNNEYYNKPESRNDDESGSTSNTQLFTRTFEYLSKDYYRFRFGIKSKEINATEMTDHFALYDKNENTVSMPMYSNSFYFYFGLINGSTAIDRLFKDYLGNCETGDEDQAYFVYDTEDASYCNPYDGSVEVYFNDIESPYEIRLNNTNGNQLYFYEDGDGNVYVTETKQYFHIVKRDDGDLIEVYWSSEEYTGSIYHEPASFYITNNDYVKIYGLTGYTGGEEYAMDLMSSDGQSKTFVFSIGIDIPKDAKLISAYKGSGFTEDVLNGEPPIVVWHNIEVAIESGDAGTLNKLGSVIITAETNYNIVTVENINSQDGIIGFVVATDSSFACAYFEGGGIIGNKTEEGGMARIIKDKIDAQEYLGCVSISSEERLNKKIYLWDDNNKYTVYAIYSCHGESGDDRFTPINIGEVRMATNKPLDIYIYDEDLLYNETILKLIDAGLCTRTNWWGYLLSNFNAIIEDFYILDLEDRPKVGELKLSMEPELIDHVITRITPKMIWNIKKALYYQTSAYGSVDNGAQNILVGPFGGTPPYTEVLFGAMERVVDYEDITVIDVTSPKFGFTNYALVCQKLNDCFGTDTLKPAVLTSTLPSYTLSLNNVLLPTIGFDLALGHMAKKSEKYQGYTKNEITEGGCLFGVSGHKLSEIRDDGTNITTSLAIDELYDVGGNSFYSRQLCLKNGNPDDNDISQKMVLSKFRGRNGPKWGPKIHYGVMYEDTTTTKDKVPSTLSVRHTKDKNDNPFLGGTYWDAYGDRFYDGETMKTTEGPQTWHNPHEDYFLTVPSIYAPFFFNVNFIIEGGITPIYENWWNDDDEEGGGGTGGGTNSGDKPIPPSVRCVFRINNGITYWDKQGGKFSEISAEINGGELELLKDKDRYYRDYLTVGGDFPNYRRTLLEDEYKNYYACDVKRQKAIDSQEYEENLSADTDIKYSVPFDLCDCMYDAMPMYGWTWDGDLKKGPFDSYCDSYTTNNPSNYDGEIETSVYEPENGKNLILRNVVNGNPMMFSFKVAEGKPDEVDEALEIYDYKTVKFFNAVDYDDSHNIRYFFVQKEFMDINGTNPFENVKRSYDYYGKVHNSFLTFEDGNPKKGDDRKKVYQYTDPETGMKDRIPRKPEENTKCKPIFSGVYSSIFRSPSGSTINSGISLNELDMKVADTIAFYDEKYPEDERDEDTPWDGHIEMWRLLDMLYKANEKDGTKSAIGGGSEDFVVGIADPFVDSLGTMLQTEDKNVSPPIWDVTKKDSNMIAVTRIYNFEDFVTLLSGRYEIDPDHGGRQRPDAIPDYEKPKKDEETPGEGEGEGDGQGTTNP